MTHFALETYSGRYPDGRLQHWERCTVLCGHQIMTGVELHLLSLFAFGHVVHG
jgi:hypothetical protein